MTSIGFVQSHPTAATMPAEFGRRRFLIAAAALSMAVLPDVATAQAAGPLVKAPVLIDIEARPIPAFDTSDRSHLRFGSLQYRSGLVLTSKFSGFGGLS